MQDKAALAALYLDGVEMRCRRCLLSRRCVLDLSYYALYLCLAGVWLKCSVCDQTHFASELEVRAALQI